MPPESWFCLIAFVFVCVCTSECELQVVHKHEAASKYAHTFVRVWKNAAVLVCRLAISGQQ